MNFFENIEILLFFKNSYYGNLKLNFSKTNTYDFVIKCQCSKKTRRQASDRTLWLNYCAIFDYFTKVKENNRITEFLAKTDFQ